MQLIVALTTEVMEASTQSQHKRFKQAQAGRPKALINLSVKHHSTKTQRTLMTVSNLTNCSTRALYNLCNSNGSRFGEWKMH